MKIILSDLNEEQIKRYGADVANNNIQLTRLNQTYLEAWLEKQPQEKGLRKWITTH